MTAHIAAALPWALAVVGLAVPMIGSGFVGWPIVVGWIVVLVLLMVLRPLRHADRPTRLTASIASLIVLPVLGTLGGFYLMPAALAWLALTVGEGRSDRRAAT